MEIDDKQLIADCLQGNEEGFFGLYKKYSASVYSIARSCLSDHGSVEDITQETFYRFFESLDGYDHRARHHGSCPLKR